MTIAIPIQVSRDTLTQNLEIDPGRMNNVTQELMDFCSKEQHEGFLQVCPSVEKYIHSH
jgi:hypothetical protein